MFKYTVALFAVIACAAAKPGVLAPLAYSVPVVAAPGVVTATSSQVIARNYNGIASAPIVTATPFAAKYVASPLAYSAPLAAGPLAYSAPLTAPLAYSSPFAAAAPLGYAGHYGYASPQSYASSPLIL